MSKARSVVWGLGLVIASALASSGGVARAWSLIGHAPEPAGAVLGGPIVGDARVGPAPELPVHYEYHYDRNALRDSRRVGAYFVALTEAGNVLAFTAARLTPVREFVDPAPATSIGQDDGGAALIGYDDGRLVRLDPSTLAPAPVVKLPGAIAWIGYRAGPVLLVKKSDRAFEVHDLARRRVHALDRRPSALLLDSKGRLWMGADYGEFGGWCRVLDLDAGATKPLAMPPGGRLPHGGDDWEGVYGFVELPGGEVWAYGGTSHMGLREGYVVRVDFPRRLASFSGTRRGRDAPPNPTQPAGPITMIAADPSAAAAAGAVLVLSYSDVYRADKELRRWRKIHTLHIRYRWGRPDAVGAYPSVRALHFTDGGDTMLLATRVDGFVRVRRGGVEDQLAIPGQLAARSIDRVENSAEGQLFIEDDTSDVAWRLDGGAWRSVDVAPPFDPHPLEPKAIQPAKDWYETKVLAGPKGDVLTINLSAMRPGTLTTAAWRGGHAVVLGRQIGDMFLSNGFVTPDGQLWNLWYGEIQRFEDGWWHRVGVYKAKPPEDAGIDVGLGLRALAAGGPPWIIFDRREGQFLDLDPGVAPGSARLAARAVKDAAGKPRRVHDAIPWRAGELLLATDAGLAVYTIASGKLGAAPFAAPPRPVTRLYLDRKDRLWLGGEGGGLWMIEGRRGAARSFEALPMLAGSTVEVIAADVDPDGVVVSLGERGVVRLRLGRD
ncbi:MAG TPA: hypothetical protein VIF57_10310 [Polyangia bacterium]